MSFFNMLCRFCIGLLCLVSIGANGQVQTIIQKGHGESAKSVDLSEDGKLLASGSRDKTIKIWDAQTGSEIRTLVGFKHTVNDVEFSRDGKLIAGSSADNTAAIFDVLTGQMLWQSPITNRYTTAISFHPKKDWIAVAGYDSPLKIWDWKENKVVQEIKCNADMGVGYGIDLTFSSDGKLLIIGEDNRRARVFSTTDWAELYSFQPEEGWCGGCGTLVDISSDGKTLAKLTNDRMAELWDLTTGELKHRLRNEVDDVAAIQFDASGAKVLVASEDSIRVFSVDKSTLLSGFAHSEKQINDACFTPSGNVVVADDEGVLVEYNDQGAIETWFDGTLHKRDHGGLDHDLSNYWKHHLAKHLKYKNQQLLIKDQWLLKGKMGKVAMAWDIKSGRPVKEYAGHEKAVVSLDYHDKTELLATGGGEGDIIIWDLANSKKLLTLTGHRDPVFDVSFNVEGTQLVSAGWGGNVIVWDVATGEKVQKIYLGNVSAYNAEFSKNGEYLILALLDKKLQVWDIDTKEVVRDLVGHTDNVTSIDVLDDYHVSTTGLDGKCIQWHVGFGLKERKVEHPYGAIYAQTRLNDAPITAGADRVIRFWSKDWTKVERELVGHQGEITALNLSSDGKTLFSHDIDGVTKVWDLESGKEQYSLVQMGRSDFVVVTPQGYFSGTSEAMKYVRFVQGVKSYAVEQFFDTYYKPEKVTEILKTGSIEDGTGLQQFMEKARPPVAKIASVLSDDKSEVTLYIKVEGKSIKELILKQNGKRMDVEMAELKVQKKDDYSVYSWKPELVGGHNVFSCVAKNKTGVESQKVEVDVMSTVPSKSANCHVLAIGIDKYKNHRLDLNYAHADASSVVDTIGKYGTSIFNEIYTTELYDEKATRADVLGALDSLSGVMNLNDVLLLFYAGHGAVNEGQFYFVTHEATHLHSDHDEMVKTSILDEEMTEALKKIPALKQIVIMDACQSGSAVELLAQRGAMEEKAIMQLSRSSGIHVLAAAGSEQFATEYQELGHGVFTYAFLMGLSGKADGAPHDGKVTVNEVKSFLEDLVPTLSQEKKGSPQYPYTFSRGHDFPIGVVGK